MKFFGLLGSNSKSNSDTCWQMHDVYGPYESDEAAREGIKRQFGDNPTYTFLIFDGTTVKAGEPAP